VLAVKKKMFLKENKTWLSSPLSRHKTRGRQADRVASSLVSTTKKSWGIFFSSCSEEEDD
jgi:hypothetical protein